MPGAKQAQIEAERTVLLQRPVDLARTGLKPLVQVPRVCPAIFQGPEHPKPRGDLCCAVQVCIPLRDSLRPRSYSIQYAAL